MDFVQFFEKYGFEFIFWHIFIRDGNRRPFQEYTFKEGSYCNKRGKIIKIAGRDEFKERIACLDFGFALDDVLENCDDVNAKDISDLMKNLLMRNVPYNLFPNIEPDTIYMLTLDLSSETHFMVFVATQNEVITINTYGGIKKMIVKRNTLENFRQDWYRLIQLSVNPQKEENEKEVADLFNDISGIEGINPPYFVERIYAKTIPLSDGKKIVVCAISHQMKLEPKPLSDQKHANRTTEIGL